MRLDIGYRRPIEAPRIPIYPAGVNPHMCRIAGEVGDGLHVHSFHSEDRRRNGRAVKQQITFYASTRTYQSVLAAHGLEDLVPRLHAKSVAGDGEGMADLITDEMLDLFGVSGRFEEIGAKIRERYRGLYDRTQLYPSFQPSLDDPRWRVVPAAFEPA